MADKLTQAKALWKSQLQVRKDADELVKLSAKDPDIEKLAKLMADNARVALYQAQKIVEKLGG